MLTISKMTPAQAAHYFEEDNYYQQADSQGNSEWWGEGAHRLGLDGVVSAQTFAAGETLRAKPKNQKTQERAGDDLTFSAPKSLSLACLVNGDLDLEEAHKKAIRRTMALVQLKSPHPQSTALVRPITDSPVYA